jgi:mannosyltransferase
MLLAFVATLFVPALTGRYLAPLVAPLLVIAAIACARSGILGLVLLLLSCSFLADPSSFISGQKSDMREVAARIGPRLRAGDVVFVTQPEQVPLAWYYFGAGLRYATPLGRDRHPSYMDWDNAQTRLQNANRPRLLNSLVAELRPGQRLVVIRPLTEGNQAWTPSWSELVRLRSAQWSALVAGDRQLAAVPWFFFFYRSSCCIASSAQIYTKR